MRRIANPPNPALNIQRNGVYTINGNKGLDLAHESLHLWQSRALNETFFPNYLLNGFRALTVDFKRIKHLNLHGIIYERNYYETMAYGHFWWN
jgi:hypothetical protein